MHTPTKLLLAALAAAFLLTLGSASASALRSLSIEGSTTLSGNGILTFNGSEGGVTIVCPTTVVGTIARVIPKVEGTATGHIIEIRIGPPEARCRSTLGTLRTIQPLGLASQGGREELWQTFYEGFSGVLPQITRLRGVLKHLQLFVEFEVPIIGHISCLYESEPEGGHADAEVERGVVGRGEIGLNHGRLVRETGGSLLCPRSGELIGQMTPLQTTVVRLV